MHIGTCNSAKGMNPFIGQSGFDSFWLQNAVQTLHVYGSTSISFMLVELQVILTLYIDCNITVSNVVQNKTNPDFVHHRYIMKSNDHITALSSGLNHLLFHSWEVQSPVCHRAGNTNGSTRP